MFWFNLCVFLLPLNWNNITTVEIVTVETAELNIHTFVLFIAAYKLFLYKRRLSVAALLCVINFD